MTTKKSTPMFNRRTYAYAFLLSVTVVGVLVMLLWTKSAQAELVEAPPVKVLEAPVDEVEEEEPEDIPVPPAIDTSEQVLHTVRTTVDVTWPNPDPDVIPPVVPPEIEGLEDMVAVFETYGCFAIIGEPDTYRFTVAIWTVRNSGCVIIKVLKEVVPSVDIVVVSETAPAE